MATDKWYIDADNGDDSMGDGSSGNPYQTLDKIFTSKSIGANGTYVFLRAGTTATYGVPTGGLNYSGGFGSPTNFTKPFRIIGWNGTDDYAVLSTFAEVALGTDPLFSSQQNGVGIANLLVWGDGTSDLVPLGTHGLVFNCELYTDGTVASDNTELIRCSSYTSVHNCYIHDFDGYAINFTGNHSGDVYRCVIIDQTGDHGDDRNPRYFVDASIVVDQCVFVVNCQDHTNLPLSVIRPRYNGRISHCAFFNNVSGSTTSAIRPYINSSNQYISRNNLFEGWDGTGAEMLDQSNSAFFLAIGDVMRDTATAYTNSGSAVEPMFIFDPDEATDSLWLNAGTYNFTPEDVSTIRMGTNPSTLGGAANPLLSETYAWKGPIQPKEKIPFHGAAGSLDGI